jgi:putative toxin-antitoxin system antitoxin component (TIGR02293 family)
MAEHKTAENKAQISPKGLQQLINDLQTSPKGQAQEEALTLLQQARKALAALGIRETVGGEEAPSVVLQGLQVTSEGELVKISELLRLRPSETLLDMHLQLLEGLPARSLTHLIAMLGDVPKDRALAEALGISFRTVQRRRKAPRKPLSPEQSGRAFKFVEVFAKAIDIFGSQEAAQAWLTRPAMGLNRQRPIDLLATSAGVELVERFLTRLDYGVYT